MDLFILWSNDLFVHFKMKNKHVHITGKDIHCICKSTMKTGWLQFDLRSPEIFLDLQKYFGTSSILSSSYIVREHQNTC